MGIDNRIFSNGKISKVLLKFAIPAVFSLLIAELYNMVDTIFVGRHIGSDAIAALTIAFPIQRLLIAIGLLIAVGASTLVARSLGENDIKSLKHAITNALFMTIVSLILVSVVIFIFRQPIITFLGASSNTYNLAETYIKIILIGGLFQSIGTVLSYIMTSLGNTKITLYANCIGALLNIIIDFILISLMGFGVAGAAIATAFSQIIAFLFVLYKFKVVRLNFNLQFNIIDLKNTINLTLVWGILAVGFSTFIIEISDAIVSVVLNNLLFAQGGDDAIVMIGIITKVSMFMFITIIGISSAMQPIIAYNYGAGNYERMNKTLKVAIITVSIASLAFWSVLMIFATPIIGFFLKDVSLLGETVKAFRICISVLPAVGIYYICIYYYQAIGEAKRSFVLSVYRQLVIFIPLSIVLINLFGTIGAWISFPISDIISSLTSIYFINKTKDELYESNKEISKYGSATHAH